MAETPQQWVSVLLRAWEPPVNVQRALILRQQLHVHISHPQKPCWARETDKFFHPTVSHKAYVLPQMFCSEDENSAGLSKTFTKTLFPLFFFIDEWQVSYVPLQIR